MLQSLTSIIWTYSLFKMSLTAALFDMDHTLICVNLDTLIRYILDLSRFSTIYDIARYLVVSWDTVKDIQMRNLERKYRHINSKNRCRRNGHVVCILFCSQKEPSGCSCSLWSFSYYQDVQRKARWTQKRHLQLWFSKIILPLISIAKASPSLY